MNVSHFFEHWGLSENPFRAEEARQDAVFDRLGVGPTAHPDFEKILGDLSHVSTAVVFGEKGAGKTAIRLQLARRIAEHNAAQTPGQSPPRGVFLAPYDDLNPVLDRYAERMSAEAPTKRKKRRKSDSDDKTLAVMETFRLVDHMDAILNVAIVRVVDNILDDPRVDDAGDPREARLDDSPSRRLRRAETGVKRDLMLLQALYDRPGAAPERTSTLRRRIGAPRDVMALLWTTLAAGGWVLPIGVLAGWLLVGSQAPGFPWLWVFLGALAIWALLLAKRLLLDRFLLNRLATRVAGDLRVLDRPASSFARSLEQLPAADRAPAYLPCSGSDDKRYEMFERLRRVLRTLGMGSMVVVVDRVDEPTLVSGDPERMRALVWPLLNNKFLQAPGVGFKLLLPIELRHALFRETSAFFQEARLDKQNLIERLSWTGPTLYDLCTARLRACRAKDRAGDEISLLDLFAEDVTRQDVVDALDQMHQPRDAFKFLYQCIQEHCSNVTQDDANWRIPRLVLETVRRQQADRVQQLFRGVRPA